MTGHALLRYTRDQFLAPAGQIRPLWQRLETADVHWHEFYELVYVLDGEARHVVNGVPHRLTRGSAFLLTPADFHEIAVTGSQPLSCYNVVIDPAAVEGDIEELAPSAADQTGWMVDAFGEAAADFHRLWAEAQEDRHGTSVVIRALVQCILVSLARRCGSGTGANGESSWVGRGRALAIEHRSGGSMQGRDGHLGEGEHRSEARSGASGESSRVGRGRASASEHRSEARSGASGESSRADACVRRAILFIDHHFREPLTLAEVAAQAHLSPNYFSERFHEITGIPFQAYLQQRRLRFARSLLAATDLGVTEVCHAAGFNSLSHFGRVYRRQFGHSPSSRRDAVVELPNWHTEAHMAGVVALGSWRAGRKGQVAVER